MSQEYCKGKGKINSGQDLDGEESRFIPAPQPKYMTVGTGSASESAARLQALLNSCGNADNDSGYGGSTGGESVGGAHTWSPTLTEDRPMSSYSPMTKGQPNETMEKERRAQAIAIHQLWYNQHRSSLARYINNAVDMLNDLRGMNAKWPAHYPSVQRAEKPIPRQQDPRHGLFHAKSAIGSSLSSESSQPRLQRRAMTSMGEDRTGAESSNSAEQRVIPEPRLITPQIAQEFSILKLDLKLGSLHQAELVHSLEKGSIASLLDGKINSTVKHLLSLRERIEDTSSKVLVTGDLNAGKSTFCNALLRRKILPEDQQPCTSIFCEVVDARENGGIEEVHAIHKDTVYDRNDESTYDVFSLKDLERIVQDHVTYTQCKVYIEDVRSIDESLLNNGVVDISIIDAPGLNSDTTKTTAIFARQEEIDVVVFVVSAANHFTLTATEFIRAAAAEKAYIFFVVNGFDNIKNKKKCAGMILKQVADLSPRSFKESGDLVHFVSSNATPTAPSRPSDVSGSSGVGGDGGDWPDQDDDNSHGKSSDKGKQRENIQDFERLEQSLRRFVLEKRAKSKLAPAKTYLLNVLGDVNTLATVNLDVAQGEIDRVNKELLDLEPVLEASQKAKADVGDEVDRTIEVTCRDVYDYARSTLLSSITKAADEDLGVPYPGILSAFQYADDLKEAILSQVSTSVTACEEYARGKTVRGVNIIKQLGILHLGDEYTDLSFRSDIMFKSKRDVLARQIEIETEIWDFFDLSTILQKQEKVAGTGMAMTLATVMCSRMIGGFGWMDGALAGLKFVGNRKLIIPGVLVAVIATTAYILSQIPQSLPQRLSSKISAELESIDYVHSNSARISSSVSKVLRFPADNLRVGLQRSVEHLGIKREETLKVKAESDVARKYFGNLVNKSAKLCSSVGAVDLEAPAPGIAPAYNF